MYTTMTTSSPTAAEQHSLGCESESSNHPQRVDSNPPGLLSFLPNNEKTIPSALPVVGIPHNEAVRQPTLLERREKKLCSASFPSLDAETLQDDCRANISEGSSASSVFRGWAKTQIGSSLSTSSVEGMVKLVSYNILAQRFVSTDLYPHCPTFALAEDYRCSLLQEELSNAAPDIIALQEVSLDVFQKPGLLGDWLRSQYHAVGNHVVITDSNGRPRSYGEDVQGPRSDNTPLSHEMGLVSPEVERHGVSPINAASNDNGFPYHRRSEMEGVCIFYLENRFELCEVVPIRFNEIASADLDLTECERRRLQVNSHNVALISVLRDRQAPHIVYVVCTVHLIWQQTACQLWQLHHVLRAVEELKQKYEALPDGAVAVVLAGDFNAEPTAPTLQFALAGQPPPDSDVVRGWRLPENGNNNSNSNHNHGNDNNNKKSYNSNNDKNKNNNTEGEVARKRYRITESVGHSLTLHDVYAAYRAQHSQCVSAVNPSTNGEGKVLDHILLDEQHVVCTAVLELSGLMDLPTKHCPSDHYPVGAIFAPRSLVA
ncbi:endonuclease/exonuclease/phosphatase [Trypanosoma theileri]|uniref:Endonuclease/exonuclease/phosphatase n=1 Tax=Trypanosoma theileri TaxID=67003 RepID=A0A1X0NZ10_9TRYP|nr:endonuclease/exonuclease/phosphatase [Trypanosoma theileri]ORC89713.1 endonuclease/exonuclease/phosphatase [Trypanosoma theileri]